MRAFGEDHNLQDTGLCSDMKKGICNVFGVVEMTIVVEFIRRGC